MSSSVKLQELCTSIETNCAERIFKMYLEIRAADIHAAIQPNTANQMIEHPYYKNPVTHISSLLDMVNSTKEKDGKKLISINIYRYIIREFTQRYRGHSYERLYTTFTIKVVDLINQGMDEDLMNYFKGLIPRQLI
jgi:hypothetical protein